MSKLLILGHVWPEPKSSAAGTRMMQIINFFISEKFEVIFATTTAETENKADLNELGVISVKIELNNANFDEFLKKTCPEIVLFDRFLTEEQFGWRVSEILPEAIKILDTEDLHSLRKAREEAFSKNKKLNKILLSSDIAKREVASIYRCDISLIISEVEMKILQEAFHIPNSLLLYLPFLFPKISEAEKTNLPVFEERKHFISIGNFKHSPNMDAVLFLKQKIWPLIRKELPEAEIHIYGAYPSKKAIDLTNSNDGFLIKGWANEAKQVVKYARVLLAPLRFGAGLKGKLAEAMQCGTPSVTTHIGAEGMQFQNKWNGFIEDDPQQFAKKAVMLYENEVLWNHSQQNGFEILGNLFQKEKFEGQLKDKLSAVKTNLEEHRLQNFTGSMLQHHQFKSTKFLSKYIEMKNKLNK